MVVLAVDQKDRNRGLFHRLDRACGGEVKMAEDPGGSGSQKAGEPGRQMHVPAYLPDDGEGRAVGTVGDDPADLRGKRQSGCHQDRRRTHGDPYQKDPGVRSEAFKRISDPVQAVPAFFNSEGNGMSPAGAVGTLFNHQQIVSLPENNLRAAAEVPGGSAAIAMEADVQGCAVMLMIVSAAEAEPVMGADRNRLIGKFAHGGDHRLDTGTARIFLWDNSDGKIVVLRPVRGIKAEAIDPAATAEKQQREKEQNKKNGHEITPKQDSADYGILQGRIPQACSGPVRAWRSRGRIRP